MYPIVFADYRLSSTMDRETQFPCCLIIFLDVTSIIICLISIQDHDVKVHILASDRHPGVHKLLTTDYPDMKHQYDLWHILKGIKKKLAKRKFCTTVCVDQGCCKPPVVLRCYLWWRCPAPEGDVDLHSLACHQSTSLGDRREVPQVQPWTLQ